jgi:hypothetical protein
MGLLPGFAGATEIKKMSDDWYLAEKMLKVDEHGKMVEKPFCFSLERVRTSDAQKIWLKSIQEQDLVARQLVFKLRMSSKYWDQFKHDKSEVRPKGDDNESYLNYLYKNKNVLDNVWLPIGMMQGSLNCFEECAVWVAYVLDTEPKEPLAQQSENERKETLKHIHMTMSVLTSDGVPLQRHAGIFANSVAIQNEKKRPERLSFELHAFAAGALRKADVKKLYMITVPALSMRTILKEKLGGELFIGVNDERIKSPVRVERGDENSTVVESFSLVDESGNRLFNASKDELNGKYRCFFEGIGTSSKEYQYATVKVDVLAKFF